MTLAEKLAVRIASEQAEIERIKADGIANVKAATARIAVLEQAQAIIANNPAIEGLIDALHKQGIEI